MASKVKTDFVLNFCELLADNGDMYFSSGSVDKDYDNITAVIRTQGFWSGTAVRYIFNKKLEFEGIQQRMFGN